MLELLAIWFVAALGAGSLWAAIGRVFSPDRRLVERVEQLEQRLEELAQ